MSLSRNVRSIGFWALGAALGGFFYAGCSTEPPPSDAPRVIEFKADPATVLVGTKTKISWKVENAATVEIFADPGGFLVEASTDLVGSVDSRAIAAATKFTLTAKAADGRTTTRTLTVNVTTQSGDVAIDEFTVTPLSVPAGGGQVELRYRTSRATRVKIDVVNGANLLNTQDTAKMASGTITATVTTNTSFVLTAEGQGGPKTDTKSVTVDAAPQIISFVASPNAIDLGRTSTLSWSTSNASSVTVRAVNAGVDVYDGANTTGTVVVSPTANETYHLTARGSGGQKAEQDVMVAVNRAARIVSFTANPSAVGFGDSSELRWEVRNATAISISARGQEVHASSQLTDAYTVTATRTTDYALTAFNTNGNATLTITLTVNPLSPRIQSFVATPNPAVLGRQSELSWRTIGAQNVRILDRAQQEIVSSSNNQGSTNVAVVANSATYTLVATNAYGETRQDLVLVGGRLPVIVNFEAKPLAYTQTSTRVTVEWETTRATSVRLDTNGSPVPGFTQTASGTFAFDVTGNAELKLTATNTIGAAFSTLYVVRISATGDVGKTATTAMPLAGDGGGVREFIDPAGDVDMYSFQVPDGGNVWIETSDGQGGCETDTFLSLIAPDGTTVLGNNDDGGPGSCSLVDPTSASFARNLAAGTYFARVRHYLSTGTGKYVILVRVRGPVCGNGMTERTEQCDDGALVGGDGCDGSCRIEMFSSVTGPGPVQHVTGTRLGAGESHYVRIVMQTEGYVRAETFVPTAGRCDTQGGSPSADTVLTLLDSNSNVLVTDDDDGIGPCSQIDPYRDTKAHLLPGTYWLRVNAGVPGQVISGYVLRVEFIAAGCPNGILEQGEACDDGNQIPGDGCSPLCAFEGLAEVEPNNNAAEATVVTSTAVPASGVIAVQAVADQDYFAIDVPDGHYLDVRVTVGSLGTCPDEPVVRLDFLGTNGTTVLGTSVSGGLQGRCPRIAPAWHGAARQVPAGRYYLRVQAQTAGTEVPLYYLHVRMLAPGCGNTVREANETCDDGNRTSGDGCSSTCAFEPEAFVVLPGTATVTGSIDEEYTRSAIQLEVTQETYVLAEVFSPVPGQCTEADASITLYASDGTTELGGSGTGRRSCADLDPRLDEFARLSTGTYYLVVESSNNRSRFSPYALTIRSIDIDRCGNGIIEPAAGEECDGGSFCLPNCRVVAIGSMSGPSAVRTFSGAITPIGDLDFVVVTATAPAYLFFETGVPTIGQCTGGDTIVRVLATPSLSQLYFDDDGLGRCSLVDEANGDVARVAPGRYLVMSGDFGNNDVISSYELRVRLVDVDRCGNGVVEEGVGETCDDGNTVAGDGCSDVCASETPLVVEVEINPVTLDHNDTATGAQSLGTLSAGTVHISAAINPMGDRDFFSFTITQTMDVTVNTFGALSQELTSCSGDTVMWLYNGVPADPDATTAVDEPALVEFDDDDGSDVCSLISGVDSAPQPVSLPAGTYYVQVGRYDDSTEIGQYYIQILLQ